MTASNDLYTLAWRYKGLDGKDRYRSESGNDWSKLFHRYLDLAKIDSVKWVSIKDNEINVAWTRNKEGKL